MTTSEPFMPMSEFEAKRAEAVDAALKEFSCDHHDKRLCRVTIADGRTAVMHQCRRCGETVGSAVSQQDLDLEALPWLQTDIRDRFRAQRDAARDRAYAQWSRERWFQQYGQYLESKRWQTLRRKRLALDNYVCQGCGQAQATQVHHLTYEHVGHEFLFELASVCDACHLRLHADH